MARKHNNRTASETLTYTQRLETKCQDLRQLCNMWMMANLDKAERIQQLEQELQQLKEQSTTAHSGRRSQLALVGF